MEMLNETFLEKWSYNLRTEAHKNSNALQHTSGISFLVHFNSLGLVDKFDCTKPNEVNIIFLYAQKLLSENIT